MTAIITLTYGIASLSGDWPDLAATLIPASLQADDALAQEVQARFPRSSVITPRASTRFRKATIDRPGTTLRSIRLPDALLRSESLICLVDLDRVSPSGPFVLDLMARFAAPFDRFRLIASRDRSSLVTEVNLARRFDRVIIARTIEGERILVSTTDMIAGELVALTLSEDRLPKDRALRSPWEDEIVQRATELELGVRFPGEIAIVCAEEDRLSLFSEAVAALHLRVGIDISSLPSHYGYVMGEHIRVTYKERTP